MRESDEFLPIYEKAFPEGMSYQVCVNVVTLLLKVDVETANKFLRHLGIIEHVPCATFLERVFPTVRIFLSCQQTELSQAKFAELARDNTVVKASTCKFNVTQRKVPDVVEGVDTPCFGSIPGALAELMLEGVFKGYFEKLGVKRPSYELDTFVQKKMGKVQKMCEIATNELHVQGSDKDAFEKIKSFADSFAKLDPSKVTTVSSWEQWIKHHVPDNYQDNLGFDRLLSIFGVADATAARVRSHEITLQNDGKEETDTLEQFSMRWLSKALVGFKPKGCLTDLVNLIFAMEHKKPEKDMSEREIVQVIEDFRGKIRSKRVEKLWIPDILMHDAENDDMLCWVLLEFIRDTLQLGKLEVHIQLPESNKFQPLVDKWIGLGENVKKFNDVNSRNERALLHNFGLEG
jgi:hypothetical protein